MVGGFAADAGGDDLPPFDVPAAAPAPKPAPAPAAAPVPAAPSFDSVPDFGLALDVVPETFAGIGALYNKKALTDVGGKEPTTYTEMLSLCDTAKSKGKVLFALGNQTNWVTQLADYALASTLVYGKTPDFAQQMTTFRTDPAHRVDAVARFGALFAGDLWDVYARRASHEGAPA